ncbi:MAG: hypothetical protein Q8P70_02420 [bacterium]|nr:hypothetical protein [bacterium]
MLKVVELLFNPRAKDRISKSFSFEGKTDQEKSAGSMYFVVEVTSALASHSRFVDRLAHVVRDEYYKNAGKKVKKKETPETFFQLALRAGNAYLKAEVKKGSVDWIGNLHVAVLVFTASQDQSSSPFRFSTMGNIKVLMARSTSLIDIQKTVESSKKESGVGPSFGSIVSGSALPGDKVLVVTHNLYQECTKQGILEQLPSVQNEKQLHEIFQERRKEVAGVPGTLTTMFVQDALAPETPLSKAALLLRKPLLWKFGNKKKGTNLSLASLVQKHSWYQKIREYRHPLSLFFTFVVVLFIGSLFFGWVDGYKEKREARQAVAMAEELIDLALQDHEQENKMEAYKKLQEAKGFLLPYKESGGSVLNLLSLAEERIRIVTGIEKPLGVELLFSFPKEGSYSIAANERVVYAISPTTSHILAWEKGEKDPFVFETDTPMISVSFVEEIGFFLGQDGRLYWIEGKEVKNRESGLPSNFIPSSIVGYLSYLYILDATNGNVQRYEDPAFSFPTPWLHSGSAFRPVGALDMAIDGNIWVATGGSLLQRYYRGAYMEDMNIVSVPPLFISAIQTQRDLPFLALLDQEGERVVIAQKDAKGIRQIEIPNKRANSIALLSDSMLLFSTSTGVFALSLR